MTWHGAARARECRSVTWRSGSALRGLIERIVLVPVETAEGGSRLAIYLQGALAGLLRLATGRACLAPQQAPSGSTPAEAGDQGIDFYRELLSVAGTRFEHCLSRYLALAD